MRTARCFNSAGYRLDVFPDMTPTFPRFGVSGHTGGIHPAEVELHRGWRGGGPIGAAVAAYRYRSVGGGLDRVGGQAGGDGARDEDTSALSLKEGEMAIEGRLGACIASWSGGAPRSERTGLPRHGPATGGRDRLGRLPPRPATPLPRRPPRRASRLGVADVPRRGVGNLDGPVGRRRAERRRRF